MFADSEDRTHSRVSECFSYSLHSAPRCASPMSHGRAVYTGRTHLACLVMLLNTHGLALGSAPQVSHKRIWTHMDEAWRTRVVAGTVPVSVPEILYQ